MLKLTVLLLVFGCAAAQIYNVCIPRSNPDLCRTLNRDGQAACLEVESRIDCAIKLARGEADFGVFNEEETLLLGQQQPNDNRVVATVRDVARTEPVAFEAVAVVPNSHTNGLAGLSGYNYCHPGLDQQDLRWSPRVLKAFENAAAALTQCSSDQPVPAGATLEEWEVERLQQFFPKGCRPGPWSYNATIDADLKRRFPNLCSLCDGSNTGNCNGYNLTTLSVSVAGVNNNNRHIQALECLRVNNNNTVAYAAWAHVREFFQFRNPDVATSYAALCPDGSTVTLTMELLRSPTAPCAFVRQPWSTIVAAQSKAAEIQGSLRSWWPEGGNPGSGGWQGTLFNGIVGGANARVFFEDTLPSPLNYTSAIRPIPSIDATSTCQPARRWCTVSSAEHTKCTWVRTAAYSLGIQPTIACLQRAHTFQCLDDIKEGRADFIASSSNYGYLARDHYNLSPVKLVQNARSDATRIAAFVRESSAQNNISRFENLREARACFPEFGGIAYVSFVRVAHERGVIAQSGCDYTRVVGEFFSGACAPGATDATHSLSNSNFNASKLCEVCKPASGIVVNDPNPFTCSWDYTNMYFGSNGSISCLANNDADIAFVRLAQVKGAQLTAMGLQESQFRALCRNNTLAATTGVNVDDGCLLSLVVDAEVVTRRNDELRNALSVLLETLDQFFGYNAETQSQHINLAIFSPFDDVKDLLFKDSAIGFTEPSSWNSNEIARNSVELFQHLESCNSAPGTLAGAHGLFSFGTMVLLGLLARFVIY
ncbi:hypothetical protein O0L34_g6306 [Tuta absoluta]|nr:hypothetical protein O0L34_g6306 [Tuta absoluta]